MPASAIAGEVIVRAEVFGRDEIAAIELVARRRVGEDVVLAARLRARAAIGAALGDHAGHEALSRVRDAERAVDERLEAERRHRGVNRADVVERILAREHDAVDAELLKHGGAGSRRAPSSASSRESRGRDRAAGSGERARCPGR